MAVLWEEIGWVDLETYLRRDDRAILPVGSCEQHGRHLSFATDYLIPTEIAMRVSARTGVPVTPTVPRSRSSSAPRTQPGATGWSSKAPGTGRCCSPTARSVSIRRRDRPRSVRGSFLLRRIGSPAK